MGHNDHQSEDGLNTLPKRAWKNTVGPFEPDDVWLRRARTEQKRIAVKEWFLARFWDPANDTPYNSAEGGYMFFDGGPYHPEDEIRPRFDGVIDQKIIDDVVSELRMEVGDDWARKGAAAEDYFDERFSLDVPDSETPLNRLKERLSGCMRVLELKGDGEAELLARKLVFSATIGVLESFLWETVQYWVDARPAVLQEIVTKVPALADQPLRLGAIFERQAALTNEVNAYLQNLVWHRWDKVAPLLKNALGVDPPSFKPFMEAVGKRHDIVHRSGHDKAGQSVVVGVEEINTLSKAVEAFAAELAEQFAKKFEPHLDF